MRHSRIRQTTSNWNFNMTPLIDVTFLLLTYFMLASHYASAEKPDMQVPHPDASQAVDRRIEEKIIVNVLYKADSEPALTFGPEAVASLDELGDRLAQLAVRAPRTQVILRADRRVPYGFVRNVMQLVADRRFVNLQIVAEFTETPR